MPKQMIDWGSLSVEKAAELIAAVPVRDKAALSIGDTMATAGDRVQAAYAKAVEWLGKQSPAVSRIGVGAAAGGLAGAGLNAARVMRDNSGRNSEDRSSVIAAALKGGIGGAALGGGVGAAYHGFRLANPSEAEFEDFVLPDGKVVKYDPKGPMVETVIAGKRVTIPAAAAAQIQTATHANKTTLDSAIDGAGEALDYAIDPATGAPVALGANAALHGYNKIRNQPTSLNPDHIGNKDKFGIRGALGDNINTTAKEIFDAKMKATPADGGGPTLKSPGGGGVPTGSDPSVRGPGASSDAVHWKTMTPADQQRAARAEAIKKHVGDHVVTTDGFSGQSYAKPPATAKSLAVRGGRSLGLLAGSSLAERLIRQSVNGTATSEGIVDSIRAGIPQPVPQPAPAANSDMVPGGVKVPNSLMLPAGPFPATGPGTATPSQPSSMLKTLGFPGS